MRAKGRGTRVMPLPSPPVCCAPCCMLRCVHVLTAHSPGCMCVSVCTCVLHSSLLARLILWISLLYCSPRTLPCKRRRFARVPTVATRRLDASTPLSICSPAPTHRHTRYALASHSLQPLLALWRKGSINRDALLHGLCHACSYPARCCRQLLPRMWKSSAGT